MRIRIEPLLSPRFAPERTRVGRCEGERGRCVRDVRGERVPSWSLGCWEVNLTELFAALERKYNADQMEVKATAQRSVQRSNVRCARDSPVG